MIALDLDLPGAIERLGTIKDGVQDVMSPRGDWATRMTELTDQNVLAVTTGARSVNAQVDEHRDKLLERPLFQQLVDAILSKQSKKVHLELASVFFETTFNALRGGYAQNSPVHLSGLVGEEAVLFTATNANEEQFDPHEYVKKCRGWFLRTGVEGEDCSIQRGRGFQIFNDVGQVCVFFDRPEPGVLTTGVLIPFSLRSYDLVSRTSDTIISDANTRYPELAKEVGFAFKVDPFDVEMSTKYPDRSPETQAALRQSILEKRPDLLEEFDRTIARMKLGLHGMFHNYLEPEKHLL